MQTTGSGQVVFRTNRRVVVTRLIYVLVYTLVVGGLMMLVGLGGTAVAIAVLALLALTSPKLLNLLRKDGTLIIAADGIRDRTSPLGFVQWDHIGETTLTRSLGLEMIELELTDASGWLKSLPWHRRILHKSVLKRGLLPRIVVGFLEADPREVKRIIDERKGRVES